MAGYRKFGFYSRQNEGLVGGMFRTLTGRDDSFSWGKVYEDVDEDGEPIRKPTEPRRPAGLFARPTTETGRGVTAKKDKQVTVIMPDEALLPAGWDLQTVRGLMDHQMAAAMYGSIDIDSFTAGPITKAMAHILDEARIQGNMTRRYPGSTENFQSMNKAGNEILAARQQRATKIDASFPPDQEINIVPSLLLGINARVGDKGFDLHKFYKGHPWADDLAYTIDRLQPDIDKAADAYGVGNVYDIAEDVMRRLKLEDPPPPEEERDGGGGGEPSSGEPPPGGGAEPSEGFKKMLSKAIKDGDAPSAADPGGKPLAGPTKCGFTSAIDDMEEKAEPLSEKMREKINKKFEDDLKNPKKSGLLKPLYPLDVYAAREQDSEQGIYNKITTAHRACYKAMLNKIGRYIAPLRSSLRIHLLAEARTRYKFEQEAGDLSQKSLYQVAQGTSSRVFQTRRIGKSKKTIVTILVDYSGSMGGCGGIAEVEAYIPGNKTDDGWGGHSKAFHAAMAACAMAEALRGMPGIKVEVASFTAYGDLEAKARSSRHLRLQHRIYKTHNTNDMAAIADMVTSSGGRSENIDGESIRWAARRMLEIPADRRILLVLSDGYPAGGVSGTGPSSRVDLKSAVQACEKAGVETIGIGIKTSAVESFYPRYTVINDTSDLMSTALRSLIDAINNNPANNHITGAHDEAEGRTR